MAWVRVAASVGVGARDAARSVPSLANDGFLGLCTALSLDGLHRIRAHTVATSKSTSSASPTMFQRDSFRIKSSKSALLYGNCLCRQATWEARTITLERWSFSSFLKYFCACVRICMSVRVGIYVLLCATNAVMRSTHQGGNLLPVFAVLVESLDKRILLVLGPSPYNYCSPISDA